MQTIRKIRHIAFCCFLLCLSFLASAQTEVRTPVDAAIGVILFDGRSDICTGTLIAPQIVLTAAHCLYRPRAGWHEPQQIFFRPEGMAAAQSYGVVKALRHPAYDALSGNRRRRIAVDLALLRLERPVPDITPLAVVPLSPGDRAVTLAHYSNASRERMTKQENCPVLGTDDGTLVIGCDVAGGASGSPVLTPYGVAAVVVARSNGEAWAAVPGNVLDAMTAEVKR